MQSSRDLIIILTISLLFTLCVSHTIRQLDAIPADSLSRFPHHVIIRTKPLDTTSPCSGSIIADEWILTSLKCIGKSIDFIIEFQRLFWKSKNYGFSIGVNNPEIHRYPTEFDNVVLIKLPIKLIFDDDLHAISVANKSDTEIANNFATMPGFNKNNGNDQLAANMFQITDPAECIQKFRNKYDEFLQICAKEWMYYKINACDCDLGSGLLINWPHRSQLIGILSEPEMCSSTHQKYAVFTNVAKYLNWMEQIVPDITIEFDINNSEF